MQCGVRDEVEVRWQEREEEGVKCFRCWRVRYHKWKCSNIEVEKRRGRKEEIAHVARP